MFGVRFGHTQQITLGSEYLTLNLGHGASSSFERKYSVKYSVKLNNTDGPTVCVGLLFIYIKDGGRQTKCMIW